MTEKCRQTLRRKTLLIGIKICKLRRKILALPRRFDLSDNFANLKLLGGHLDTQPPQRQDLDTFFKVNAVLNESLGESPGAQRAYKDAITHNLDPPLSWDQEQDLIRYAAEPSALGPHVLMGQHAVILVESWGLHGPALKPDSIPYFVFNRSEPDEHIRLSLLLLTLEEDFLAQSPYVLFGHLLVRPATWSKQRLVEFSDHFRLQRNLLGPACLAAYDLAKSRRVL